MLEDTQTMPKLALGTQSRSPSPRDGGRRPLIAGLLAVAALMLGGCSTLSGFDPFAQKPTAPDRFVLADDDTDVVGQVQVAVAHEEDTLPDFARRYGLGHDELVAANPGVDVWLPGQGTKVVLPTQFVLPKAPRQGIVINLATLRLFYYPKREKGEPQVVVTHPIGIGREGWRTPLGRMRITSKVENPTWIPTDSVRREHAKRGDILPGIVRAGPDNPLGAHAMRLSRPRYLIHGTNKPYGVGMRVSHGCIRLYPEDVAELFQEVPTGTRVTVVNQPYLAGRKNGELYLEAHAPLAEDAKRWKGSLKPMQRVLKERAKGTSDEIDWERAEVLTVEGRGIPAPVTVGSQDLETLVNRAKRVPRIPPWAKAQEQDS